MNKSSFSDGPVFFLYQQQGFLASVTHFHNNDLLILTRTKGPINLPQGFVRLVS